MVNVKGKIRIETTKEVECYECGHIYDKDIDEVIEVDEAVDVWEPGDAVETIIQRKRWFDFRWIIGPEVTEIPVDQLLIRPGAPMLPGLEAVARVGGE